MKPPKFTVGQLGYLLDLLTPRCCHTSGEHDPTHFDDKRYVCQSQKAEAFDRARASLGFLKAKPEDAVPDPKCGWCKSSEHKAHVKKRHKLERAHA